MSTESKRKHVFISHHHKDDAEVSKFTALIAGKGYDVRNSSIRVNPDNDARLKENRVSEAAIKRLLKIKMKWASKVVVLIGDQTHSRDWVNWEIELANKLGKRLVGVFVRGGTDADVPESFKKYSSTLIKWNSEGIIKALEGENNYENPDGSPRPLNDNPPSPSC